MDKFWTGKKVTAYIALKHHTRFIIPIMNTLKMHGAQINYLVAQAERSQEITAIETGLQYNHIFDFLTDDDTELCRDIYLDMRDTFGPTLLKDIAYSLQVPTVIDKTLYTTAQEYVAFKKYFQVYKPDLCLALHEVNRWGKMFAYHAKCSGVPMITLQEGLLTTASANLNYQMTGHVQYSTLCFVWGEGSRQKLAGFEAPADRIIPTGNTHLSNEIKKLNRKKVREKIRKRFCNDDKFVVLLLYSATITKADEFIAFFEIFKHRKNIELFIKFHPATSRVHIDNWLATVPDEILSPIKFIHGEEDTYDLIAMSDLCVIPEGSTTGLEALAIGKPLILLDLTTPIIYKTDIVEKKAALSYTPKALAKALIEEKNFDHLFEDRNVEKYIQHEVFKAEDCIDYTVEILKQVISANSYPNPEPIKSRAKDEMEWSIILPVSENPDIFLAQLEAIATKSKNENFEVILLKRDKTDPLIDTIIESLEGDFHIIPRPDKECTAAGMNKAAAVAKGKNLIFLEEGVCPVAKWMDYLNKGFETWGEKKIFGAKLFNQYNNIIHAGMIIDINNQPVSAYQHLDHKFPHVCRSRPFQIINHFVCINRRFFLLNGGFESKSGTYLFMDLCLRISQIIQDPEPVIYLHDVELISHHKKSDEVKYDGAIFFYSKWHHLLLESESKLLKSDGVSTLQIEAARMTRAMETANSTPI